MRFTVSIRRTKLNTDPSDPDPRAGKISNEPYWQNISLVQGDMRPDGVWLGACGISAKDATLKYEMAGNDTAASTQEFTVQMWVKTTWRVNDGYEHEFFNATDLSTSRTIVLSKGRQYAGTTPYDGSGGRQLDGKSKLSGAVNRRRPRSRLFYGAARR